MPPLASRTFRAVAALALTAAPMRAIKAIGWLLRGKRVRGWNQLCWAAATHPAYYRRWTEIAEPKLVNEWIGRNPANVISPIAVLVLDSEPQAEFETAASVTRAFGLQAAIYTCDEFRSLGHHSIGNVFNHLIETRGHSWVLPLRAGDILSPYSGQILATVLTSEVAPIVYWDEDRWDGHGRTQPWIKPDWDEFLFLAKDSLSGSAIFGAELAWSALGELEAEPLNLESMAQLTLRMTASSETPPHHIPLILTHRRSAAGFVTPDDRCAFIARNWPVKIRCRAVPSNGCFARISPHSPKQWPKISILIPTKDRGRLLETCTNSLRYVDYDGELEIIIIDNGSTESIARDVLDRLAEDPIVKVLDAPGPFNFSSLNNLAAREASGELLCLLNNDVEATDRSWLQEMARFALLDDVGAVGAQLLFPDGSIQHAGVAIGVGGAAGHVEKGRRLGDRELAGWHSITREVSAVTAACMMVRADLYRRMDGLDERHFPVAFNDVDFCLRLKSEGYRNIILADAQLIHHESVSRGSDHAAPNVARFRSELAHLHARWATRGYRDPHFSPLFSETSELCLLAF